MDDLARRVLPGLLDTLAPPGTDRATEPKLGERIGPYRLLSVLGRGGMGVVFRAQDEQLDRLVALKFLDAPAVGREAGRERLLDEARAAARLDHPGIAVVHEVGETDEGRPFMVMAQCDGETLAGRIARETLPIDAALDITRQIADALTAAHRAGIVHRDVKPANIVVNEAGRVKIVDFGIAGGAAPGAAPIPHAAGTLPYMSPEQLDGKSTDARTDVWAVGVVLFEMLTGVRPFGGEDRAAVAASIRAAHPLPLGQLRPDAPPAVAAIVDRCLARRAHDRFPSAQALLSALVELGPAWPRTPADGPGPKTPDGTRLVADHCRRGRHFLDGGDPPSVARARDAFLAALDLDPLHAPAWCGLSDAYELQAYLTVLPPEEAHLRARAAAERALALDPDLAAAHVSLATVLLDYYRDWAGAEKHYRRALTLDPSYAPGHQLYAEFLRDQGRFDEALVEIDEAIRLDPLSPYYRLVHGIVLRMARRQDEAVDVFQQLLAATPDYRMGHFFLGLTYASLNEHARALAAFDHMDPDGTFPDAVALRGVVHARAGRRAEAESVRSSLDTIGAGHHVLPFHHALIHLNLGAVERAITLLEEDADRRSWFSRILGVEPFFDEVRDHPRFQALLARVGPQEEPEGTGVTHG